MRTLVLFWQDCRVLMKQQEVTFGVNVMVVSFCRPLWAHSQHWCLWNRGSESTCALITCDTSWKWRCQLFSRVRLFVTLWTAARQAPLPMGFSRQESWSGVSCPPPGDLPGPGIEPRSPDSSYLFLFQDFLLLRLSYFCYHSKAQNFFRKMFIETSYTLNNSFKSKIYSFN